MDDRHQEYPECFGDLEKVFPLGENGLRNTPNSCYLHCAVKTFCLREAIKGPQGSHVQEELLERQEQKGIAGFFYRWSRKKQIHRQRCAKKGGGA